MKDKTKAFLLLSFLSPFIAEVLSGSTPPLEVITEPLSFPLLWAFYGVGVIFVREAWIRWGRNYLSLMLLGFSYGIFEEGIIIKSWYNPNWPDLGVFAYYGRIWGINTTWAVWLTIFHSIMSITAPIIIVDYIYPNLRNEKFVEKRNFIPLLLLIAIPSILLYVFLAQYNAPLPQYLLSLILFLLFIIIARKIEKESLMPSKWASRHPFLYGFAISLLLFLVFTAIPHSSLNPLIPMLLGIFIVLHFYSQMNVLKEKGTYLLLLGFLGFWLIPYDIILELNGVLGEAILGPLMFIILILLWKRRESRI